MLRRLGLAACMAVMAGSAQAMICTFEAECFEQDGCMESGFGFEVMTSDEGALQFVTEFGDLDLVWSSDDIGTFSGVATGAGAQYFLTSGPDGARLSVHLDGPVAVTYIGQCEGGL
jgi:hypothetical protein